MGHLTAEEEKTLGTYERNAEECVRGHRHRDFLRPQFEQFRSYLPSGKIIEIGAGGGRDAQLFLNAGYEYLGTDISHAMLDVARRHAPTATFEQRSIYELAYPAGSFDGFWAAFVFHHIPKERATEALVSLRRVLRTGAVGFVSVKEGDGERMVNTVDAAVVAGHDDRFFAFYRRQELHRVMETNGFEVLDTRVFRVTLQDSHKNWVALFVSKM